MLHLSPSFQKVKCLISFTILIILMLAFLFLVSCLGKTSTRIVYYIPPQKRIVFVATPVNYTSEFALNQEILDDFKNHFSSIQRFSITDQVEDSQLYLLLYIDEYYTKEVENYGFGNTLLYMKVSLFLSDNKLKDERDKENRYYFKNTPIEVQLFENVVSGDALLSLENAKKKLRDKLVESVTYLMETGKLPPANL